MTHRLFLLLSPLILVVAACGGGASSADSSGQTATTPPPSTSTQSDNAATNFPTLASAFNQLPHTDANADATAMVAAAQALPDVQASGLSNSYTVWIAYKDGTSQIITTLPRGAQADAIAQSTSTPAARRSHVLDAALPTGRRAFIYSALEGMYLSKQYVGDPVTAIQGWLSNQGYSVDTKKLTAPEDLENITNASVFYLDTHGGVGVLIDPITKVETKVFGIATAIPATKANIDYYDQEIHVTKEMGYYGPAEWLNVTEGQSPFQPRIVNYLYITPAFVMKHMSFTSNSLVFINGCEMMSSGPEAQAMVQAFQSKGATNVLGWDTIVNENMAADSAMFLFDRMLGANQYPAYIEQIPNRPFNLSNVVAHMANQQRQPAAQGPAGIGPLDYSHLTLDTAAYFIFVAHLKLVTPLGGPLMSLAPSIGGLVLENANDALVLYGDFGGAAQSQSVTIGGAAVTATSWTSDTIEIALPPTGPGSSGAIQVTMDGAKSNQPLLNQWSGVQMALKTINGPNQRIVTCTINLRTTFDTFRYVISGDPESSNVTVDNPVLPNGQCQFVATGQQSGSGALPWYTGGIGTAGANVFGTAVPDGLGGGRFDLSMQGFYSDIQLGFTDTGYTGGAGYSPSVDDATQNLAAGSFTQYLSPNVVLDVLSWGSTPPLTTPDQYRAR